MAATVRFCHRGKTGPTAYLPRYLFPESVDMASVLAADAAEMSIPMRMQMPFSGQNPMTL